MNSTALQGSIPPLSSLERFISHTYDQNRFLVLDCYASEFFESRLDSFGIEESARFRMPVHTVEGDSSDPLLVHLNEENAETLMQAALEQAVGDTLYSPLRSRSISAVISSASEPEHVAGNFARAARYHMRGESKSVAFRFFDPRVMHTLQRLLSPLQTAMLLGPVTYWGYVDFRAQFRLVTNTSPRYSSSVVIQDEQVSVLRRNATVQTALYRLRKFRANWPEDLDALLDGFLQHAPEELHDVDISHRVDDLATYAALHWLCDTGHADRQLIEQALKMGFDTGAPLKAVLETLSPDLF